MKQLLFLAILFTQFQIFAQEIPKVTVKNEGQLKLSSLKVNVKILGNYAETTYDMMFYNELDRTLEGELTFPLSDGQSVSRFEMEVNGKLRKAVVVEKELARVAFESTVRQNIDPGLLEKTQGNNYKARIYPILPQANKRIVLTYEQELSCFNEHLTYELPLGIKEILDEFSLNVEINGGNGRPILKDSFSGLQFKESLDVYHATFTEEKFSPSHPIVIKVPVVKGNTKVISYADYFHINLPIESNARLKSKPEHILVLWDASKSLRYRNLKDEIKLLDQYFSYLQNVEVEFVVFSNKIHWNKSYQVVNGNWKDLKNYINEIQYDGGTSMSVLDELKSDSDEILLFSDGLSNLGSFSKPKKQTVYTVCSVVSADHQCLEEIAVSSGGQYLNLLRQLPGEACELLKLETFQYLGVKKNKRISEVYPSNINVNNEFSLAGRFEEDAEIELLFGYRGKVERKVPVMIQASRENKLVKRLWAKQKMKYLSKEKKKNKEQIIALAKKYQLVTDFTSMLILDRIEDYVRYRIEPPKELRNEYKERIKNIEESELARQDNLKERLDENLENCQLIREWYQSKFPKKDVVKVVKKASVERIQETTQESTRENTQGTRTANTAQRNVYTSAEQVSARNINSNSIDSTLRIISGRVIEHGGLGMPGVSVVIKGTTKGTVTNIDGYYALNAEENDELVFSFVGMLPENKIVGSENEININLRPDAVSMDEVVVVGYASQAKSVTTASMTIVQRHLSGQVAGVQIQKSIANSSGNNNTEHEGKGQLFVVDGVVVSGNPIASLKSEDIDQMQIIKAESATKIYGARASNGLIMITTKKGKESNAKAINELNEKISAKIELKSWNPDVPYIEILEQTATVNQAYEKYLVIRDEYSNSPSFYLDVADFFDKRGSSEIAIRILTNLLEEELDNHELMRALAYKLEYFQQYEMASMVYEKVLELRPEEPQSYRDLALAYEQVGEVQKSFDLLYKIYRGDLLEKDEEERYYGIEQLAFVELSHLIQKYKDELQLDDVDLNDFPKMPVDVRVVIDWNHNDTDIDLWVIDPNKEKAYYKNVETKIGGHMSEDLTEGYGPEEFMLRDALKGNYNVLVDYYSDDLQKISGPTILKVTLFTNYGKKNEQKKTIIIRLDKEEEELEVGSFKI